MGTAVITGCTRGIGAAITEKFLDHGCDICGCYSKDVGNAKWFLESLGECREKLTLFQADLSTWEGIGQFIEGVKAAVSSVDYLVLNAGMTDYTPFREISHEKWEKVLRLNLYAPLFITQGLDSIMNGGGGLSLSVPCWDNIRMRYLYLMRSVRRGCIKWLKIWSRNMLTGRLQ